ncbi:unnamed protein product [Schistosoma curassoni]|uniref:Uncharacterized protein n=1 Tax=Schistosoma curassoni TaxID=6186 RepID=A0A183K992_9TREM|nr:unnamed protein product [Schistosoma curassoni]
MQTNRIWQLSADEVGNINNVDFNLISNYSIEELTIQNRRLNESNERLENRLQLIIQTINELDNLYNSIKNDGFIKRYTTLKDAVKRIVTNNDLYDNP